MKLRRILIIVAAILVVAAIGFVSAVPLTSARAREAVIAELSDRLDSTVDLETFEIRVLPRLRAEGSGLAIHHKGRRDVPPLITIRKFVVTGGVVGLLRGHAGHMTVEGLEIVVPPRPEKAREAENEKSDRRSGQSDPPPPFVIDELVSNDATFALLPRDSHRPPKVWRIHQLRMQSVGDRSMPFEALLTNAVPPGEIATKGNFGPWDREDPDRTPLDGSFLFERANLEVFKGIAGILSSRGTFGGELGRIDVDGQTETPDFTVKISDQPVPLFTRYKATVDGTNGDTILNQIDGSFLNTSLSAKGRVAGTPGVKGRTVTLDVTIDKGRIEDVLRLAVKTARPMVGELAMQTKLIIPPGDRDVIEKLQLDGRFELADARFTNTNVSRKITELSQRGRGQTAGEASERVPSDFAGTFKLANRRLTIPAVSFDVPGAAVRLAGHYDLAQEDMDFRGTLFTDVKVSQTTGGIKGLLLKMIDPLFRREGGGSAIPIKVTGSPTDPSFGLDAGRVLSRDDDKTPAPPPR